MYGDLHNYLEWSTLMVSPANGNGCINHPIMIYPFYEYLQPTSWDQWILSRSRASNGIRAAWDFVYTCISFPLPLLTFGLLYPITITDLRGESKSDNGSNSIYQAAVH
ncbi:hypothetical protein ACTXT7_011114 [Hymenolepis weldensis]